MADPRPLDPVRSIKTKLGLLVAVSVVAAGLLVVCLITLTIERRMPSAHPTAAAAALPAVRPEKMQPPRKVPSSAR